jgi:hypothetical protein
MPVDFQQVRESIIKLGQQAPARQAKLDGLRSQAQQLLDLHCQELDFLRKRVEQAGEINPRLRCAVPGDEVMNKAVPLGEMLSPETVLAGDGSQIAPDPHGAVEFALVNAGAFIYHPGSGSAPEEKIHSRLLYGEDLYPQNGMLTEEMVNLQRDLAERLQLAELAETAARPVIALTDGPVELFGQPIENVDFKEAFSKYLAILKRLAAAGVGLAGYVDRPRADLVVRLLELGLLPEEHLSQAGRERPLAGVSDVDLFRPLLREPGARSPIFGLRSFSSKNYTEEIALHFFYLNVSLTDKPYLARVETPAWVVNDDHLLKLLHATLVAQSQIMGVRPYPYALQRAHEIAVVRLEEKQQLSDMIQAELLRRGMPVGDVSHKQSGKNLKSRTRYSL